MELEDFIGEEPLNSDTKLLHRLVWQLLIEERRPLLGQQGLMLCLIVSSQLPMMNLLQLLESVAQVLSLNGKFLFHTLNSPISLL